MSLLRNSYGRISDSGRVIIRAGTDDGLPDGEQNANVNGSITPVDFYVQPVPGETFAIKHISIEVSDSGNPGIDDYGNIVGPLANGIGFFVELDGVKFQQGTNYHSNRELMNLGPVTQQLDFSGSTKVTIFNFDLASYDERGIVIQGKKNEKFGITINDDLTTLIHHGFNIKGMAFTEI